jgi:hypothetical protein
VHEREWALVLGIAFDYMALIDAVTNRMFA